MFVNNIKKVIEIVSLGNEIFVRLLGCALFISILESH